MCYSVVAPVSELVQNFIEVNNYNPNIVSR